MVKAVRLTRICVECGRLYTFSLDQIRRAVFPQCKVCKGLLDAPQDSAWYAKPKKPRASSQRPTPTLPPYLHPPTYEEYLHSELWHCLRNTVLNRDHYRCRICHKPASQVHHLDYSHTTMAGTRLHRLVAICHPCHKRISFDAQGRKRSTSAANRTFRNLVRKQRSSPRTTPWHQPSARTRNRQVKNVVGQSLLTCH